MTSRSFAALLLVVSGSLAMAQSALVDSHQQFSFDFFKAMASGDKNVLVSPYSASSALSIAASGASGATRKAILDSLRYKSSWTSYLKQFKATRKSLSNNQASTLLDSNSIWVDQDFALKPTFAKLSKSNFDAKVSSLDFSQASAPQTINAWVRESTRNTIDGIVDKLSKDTPMVLANAVYFKGAWTSVFEKEDTSKRSFYGATTSSVDMMYQSGRFAYANTDDLEVLRLPYKGNRAMYILLPSKNTTLEGWLPKLNAKTWRSYKEALTFGRGSVRIPKFQLSYNEKLDPTLKSMGMKLAYSDKATFDRISKQPLAISTVQQKTFINVTEAGTEASAVTSITFTTTSMPIEETPFEFEANRPFVMVIEDQSTDMLLFMGAVRSL